MDPKDMGPPDRSLPPHPSLVQDRPKEEPEQKQTRPCLFPPINAPQKQIKEKEEPGQITHYEQRRRLEENCLLAELTRIEKELRDNMRRERERQEALYRVRQEENHERWRSLCFMSLNQRVNKPWVFSFYKNFPMHIYCLPIQADSHRNRKKRFRR